jgi:hypothetical protein
MMAKARFWLAGVTVLLVAVPVLAQPGWRAEREHRFVQRQMVPDAPVPPRDFRRNEFPRRGRLSAEERRQLRRDIQDAGQDLYRREALPPPPPPPF